MEITAQDFTRFNEEIFHHPYTFEPTNGSHLQLERRSGRGRVEGNWAIHINGENLYGAHSNEQFSKYLNRSLPYAKF